MPSKKYIIFIKGIACFVKYSSREFESVCRDMDILNVKYTTQIIDLTTSKTIG